MLKSEVAGRWKTYGLFGEIYQNVNLSSTAEAVTFGFTGHVVDRESGLNRTKHRQYDSEAGRWLSQDPIGFISGDGPNYYWALRNNPLKYTDPSGMSVKEWFEEKRAQIRERFDKFCADVWEKIKTPPEEKAKTPCEKATERADKECELYGESTRDRS